jgi:hypothetical protein
VPSLKLYTDSTPRDKNSKHTAKNLNAEDLSAQTLAEAIEYTRNPDKKDTIDKIIGMKTSQIK